MGHRIFSANIEGFAMSVRGRGRGAFPLSTFVLFGLSLPARPIPIVTIAPSLLLLLSKDRDRGAAPSQHKLLLIYGDVISGEEGK